MTKAASLSSGLVVKKGQATPAVPYPALDQEAHLVHEQKSAKAQEETQGKMKVAKQAPVSGQKSSSAHAAAPKATGSDYYKALTVKLDRGRYEALKTVGMKLDRKSQEIFVDALDQYLRKVAPQA
jgi:hypothetical protein